MQTMIRASQHKSQEKMIHTHKVIFDMLEQGKLINFYTVAESAGVSRQFLYSHDELRNLIIDCRVTGMTKQELQQEVIRLRMRIRELELQLSNC